MTNAWKFKAQAAGKKITLRIAVAFREIAALLFLISAPIRPDGSHDRTKEKSECESKSQAESPCKPEEMQRNTDGETD
jgi:hypothetical protein